MYIIFSVPLKNNVYRLWGITNYFFCGVCKFYYSSNFASTCKYHPDDPLYKTNSKEMTTPHSSTQLRRYFPRRFHDVEENKSKEGDEEGSSSASNMKQEELRIFPKFTCCNSQIYLFNPLPKAEVRNLIWLYNWTVII